MLVLLDAQIQVQLSIEKEQKNEDIVVHKGWSMLETGSYVLI